MSQPWVRQERFRRDATLSVLLPEQQIQLAHRLALPTVKRLRRQHWFVFLPFLAFFVFLLGQLTGLTGLWLVLGAGLGLYLAIEITLTRRDRQNWSYLKRQVCSQAACLQSTEGVAPLLDFAHWLTQLPLLDEQAFHGVQGALERLLPRLDAAHARALTDTQRAFLRRCAENQEPSVEFVSAALLVLGSAQDRASLPVVRTLAYSSSSQRIRDAALFCLEELGESA